MEVTLPSGDVVSLDEDTARVWGRTVKLAEAMNKADEVFYFTEYMFLALRVEAARIFEDFELFPSIKFGPIITAMLQGMAQHMIGAPLKRGAHVQDDPMMPDMRDILSIAKRLAHQEQYEEVGIYHLVIAFLRVEATRKEEHSYLRRFGVPIELLEKRLIMQVAIAHNTEQILEATKSKDNLTRLPTTGS